MAKEFKPDVRVSNFSPPQGKGSKRRPGSNTLFESNYESIFGKRCFCRRPMKRIDELGNYECPEGHVLGPSVPRADLFNQGEHSGDL